MPAAIPASLHPDRLVDHLGREKVVAILRAVSPSDVVEVARTLHAAGVRLLEVAFDRAAPAATNAALVAAVTDAALPGLHVGAGTVRTTDEVRAAADAGARFVLSPDLRDDVVEATLAHGLLSMPGALTPTEVAHAHDLGAHVVKVFPAATLGPRYLRELHGPLPAIRLSAVGGISADNARDYLDAGALCVGVGSSLLPRTPDGRVDLPAVAERAAALVEAVRPER